MTVRSTLSHRGCSRILLLVLCAALVPLPTFAAEASASSTAAARPGIVASPAPTLQAAVVQAVNREVASRPATAARRSTQPTPNADSPSFFRTKAGVMVLAVFAAGVGYAIYSTQNDRINSPGKE